MGRSTSGRRAATGTRRTSRSTSTTPIVSSAAVPLASSDAELPLRRARRAAEKAQKPSILSRRSVPVLSRTLPSKRRVIGQLASVGTMVGVFALLVSTSLPATAFTSVDELAASAAGSTGSAGSSVASSLNAVPVQEVTVNAKAAAAAADTDVITRDNYEAKSFQQQVALLRGNPNFSFTNNPNGTIQWPFPGSAPISSGFGPRAVCSYCSSYHLGVDFTPGAGVPIQSISEGVVSEVNLHSGGLGNHVIIDHVINGQRVQSVYAHMQWGSIQVAVGQPVSVGTIVGAVGSTGVSTGAHLHLEIHIDGTPVDPYVWLKANAN